jgi:GntR family transcriptional regulator
MDPAILDKRVPVPLYHQLKTILLDRIRQGLWKPGEQLPTEDKLVSQFGVSKATVRQALRDLAEAGMVRREQGRGTFVAPTRIQFGPRRLSSFTEEMRASGLETRSRVLEQHVVPAPAQIAGSLEIAEGADLFLLRRLRLAGGEPMGLQTVHISAAYVPGIADISFEGASLYQTLEHRYGLAPEHASQKHFAMAVDAGEAGLLNIPVGSPALGGERLTFLPGGRPLELTYSIMRGDRYQIELNLVRMPER